MDRITIDPEIVATCNALGHKDENTGKYVQDPDCLECLRDLIRFLRHDNEDFKVRRQLAATNVVVNDLIYLLKDHCLDDKFLFDVVLRLLVNLTNPAILLFKEEVPTDKHKKGLYLELLQILYSYKVAFASEAKCWGVLALKMTDIISVPVDERLEENSLLFERCLILIRNLLHVPIDSYQDETISEEMNPQDRMIVMMKESGVSDMIMLLAESEDETHFCFHVLEIVSLMMREQSPEFLAKSYDPNKGFEEQVPKKRNQYERSKDEQELELILAREKSKQRPIVRHRFKEATYQIKNMKSLSDKDMIYHKPLKPDLSLDLGSKQATRKARNRRALQDADFGSEYDELKVHKSIPKVRAYLSQFALTFLNHYNQLMHVVKDALRRKKNQDNDESYFLWSAYFFMEYNRNSKSDVSLVSETYSVESLHYFHTQITDYTDKIKMEKKNYLPWSRRLHYALKAYRELILSVAFMTGSTEPEFKDITKEIKWTAFYEEEYRELLVNLFKEYIPAKMSRRYLIDLVVTNHVFLRMFKSYCNVNESVSVKVKTRKKRKRTRRTKKQIERAEQRWADMNQELRDCLAGVINLPTAEEDENVLPIVPTAEYEPEIQKVALMKKLKHLLFEENVASAVALLRNARETYPDDPEKPFGPNDPAPDDEEMALKDIYDSQDLDQDSEEENADTGDGGKVEKSLQFIDMFKKYSVPRVLIPHVILLKDFDKNSPQTNHAIVKYLHRLAFEYDLIGMLYQASIFRIFQRIFKQPVTDEWSKELNSFAKYVVRKFFETFKKNDKILVELLFWKNAREARALIEGYDSSTIPNDNDDDVPDAVMPPISEDDEDDGQKDGSSNDQENMRKAKRKIFDESDDESRSTHAESDGQNENEKNNSNSYNLDPVNAAASQLLHDIDDDSDLEDNPLHSQSKKSKTISQTAFDSDPILQGQELFDFLMNEDNEDKEEKNLGEDEEIFGRDTDKEDADMDDDLNKASSPHERPDSRSSEDSFVRSRKKKHVVIESDDDE